jgi:PAS domain S-box-containing protein
MEIILDELNESVFVVDSNNRIVFANEALLRLTGFQREELQGRIGDHFYPPEDLANLMQLRAITQHFGRHRQEFVVPHHDGKKIPVLYSGRVIQGPDGQEYRLIILTDISAQKGVEEQLRQSNVLLEKRQKEIEEELALAARVQQSLVPRSMVWGNVAVESHYSPATSIGGDFGVVLPHGDDFLSLLVCDVSGHGIGSALLANRIYSETIFSLRSGTPLGDMLRQLNRFVMRDIGGSVFFCTLAVARLDRDARRMTFAGAGHPPAMIVRPGEEPRLLESRSIVLGLMPDAVDEEATLDVDLQRGDRIVLYTDGLTDVFDSRGEILGVEGVQRIVRETAVLPFPEMKEGILDRIAAWREGPPKDDTSLVMVELR